MKQKVSIDWIKKHFNVIQRIDVDNYITYNKMFKSCCASYYYGNAFDEWCCDFFTHPSYPNVVVCAGYKTIGVNYLSKDDYKHLDYLCNTNSNQGFWDYLFKNVDSMDKLLKLNVSDIDRLIQQCDKALEKFN